MRIVSLLFILLFSQVLFAERSAVGDDGREIVLNNDGSWAFKNTDRFATSEDGKRVRLKANGQWESIGNTVAIPKEKRRIENTGIQLSKVVTEYYKRKIGSKITRFDSQTIFYLSVDISTHGNNITPDFGQDNAFVAKDNKGKIYDLINITPMPSELRPGENTELAIRFNGSPKGSVMWGIKDISLIMNANVLGNSEAVTFTKRTDEIVQKKVDKF